MSFQHSKGSATLTTGTAPPTTLNWHDEQTQRVPLSLPGAQLVTQEELEITLGGAIWAQRRLVAGRVVHWMAGPILVAVVDSRAWRAALRPQAARSVVEKASFTVRPPAAATPPDEFRSIGLDNVLWKFGLLGRDGPRYLPPAYLQEPLLLRGMPALEPGLLAHRHLTLMRLLGQEPLRFEQVQQRLGADPDDLRRDFTALYLTRALVLARDHR